MQAIKASDCYTEDIEQAQAVYVYDYCYYIWWVATLHSRGAASMTNSPGDYLIRVRTSPCSLLQLNLVNGKMKPCWIAMLYSQCRMWSALLANPWSADSVAAVLSWSLRLSLVCADGKLARLTSLPYHKALQRLLLCCACGSSLLADWC